MSSSSAAATVAVAAAAAAAGFSTQDYAPSSPTGGAAARSKRFDKAFRTSRIFPDAENGAGSPSSESSRGQRDQRTRARGRAVGRKQRTTGLRTTCTVQLARSNPYCTHKHDPGLRVETPSRRHLRPKGFVPFTTTETMKVTVGDSPL